MFAKREMLETLCDADFRVIHQTRAGLSSFSPDAHTAKGQLAASTVLQLQLRPQLVHVVAFCEGNHAATVEDIEESCAIVRGVIRQWWEGMPDMTADPVVQARRQELIDEAWVLLEAIAQLADAGDPFTSPVVLAQAIKLGYLDAPGLWGNKWAQGLVMTAPINGAIRAVNPSTGQFLNEQERLASLPTDIV